MLGTPFSCPAPTSPGAYRASTHTAPSRALRTAAWMKYTPRAPSSAVGKSPSSGSGASPAARAAIVRIALAYTLANASWNPSGCPDGSRVACRAAGVAEEWRE